MPTILPPCYHPCTTPAQLTDTQLERSGHQEAADACKNTNEDLLAQLNAGKVQSSELESAVQACENEKVGYQL